MLLFYGITFALIGEKTLYRLDISYSTYETLRMFLGVLIPILFLLWGVAGTIIAERKTLSRGELTIRLCILACSTVIVIGTCYQEQLITRERFRDHDCRAALKQYFAAFIFMDLQYIGQTVFKSLNKKKQAIFFSLLRKVFIVVPLTYLMPYVLHMGTDGVFLAEPVSNVIGGSLCFITMLILVLPELKRMEQQK